MFPAMLEWVIRCAPADEILHLRVNQATRAGVEARVGDTLINRILVNATLAGAMDSVRRWYPLRGEMRIQLLVLATAADQHELMRYLLGQGEHVTWGDLRDSALARRWRSLHILMREYLNTLYGGSHAFLDGMMAFLERAVRDNEESFAPDEREIRDELLRMIRVSRAIGSLRD